MNIETLLHDPPSTVDEGELAGALLVAPPSRRSKRVTTALVVLLLVAVGVLGGLWWGNHTSATADGGMPGVGAPTGQLPQGFPGGGGGFGAELAPEGTSPSGTTAPSGAGSSVSSLAVVGTVVKVDGDTVTVKDLGGTQHAVRLAPSGTVTRSSTISARDLEAGETVAVSGSMSGDGSVDATGIVAR